MSYKLIFKMGEFYRNNKIRKHFNELMKTDFADIIVLEQMQLTRLKKLLKHARENSKFYKDALKDIDIENFELDQISSLPIMSKEGLKQNQDSIQNDMSEKMFLSGTSGSTGNALVFERNSDWDASHRAAQLRGYRWFGIEPWMKNLYFWGFNPSFVKKLKMRLTDILMNRYRVFDYEKRTVDKAKRSLENAQYIEGYSSAVFALAQKLDKENVKFDNILLVKGTSEKIFDFYQNSVKSVFGKKMVSEYGAAESGIIAFECPSGRMHIVMENVIVEEVNNKILVTNLFSYSFPIIRYELGDYIKLNTQEKCSCGRSHYIIDEVTGRIGEEIVGKKKNYPSLTLYYVFKNISLGKKSDLAYFACQDTKGKITIRVLSSSQENETIRKYIDDEMNKYFNNDLEVNIKFVEKLDMQGRKSQSFISYLNDDRRTCN